MQIPTNDDYYQKVIAKFQDGVCWTLHAIAELAHDAAVDYAAIHDHFKHTVKPVRFNPDHTENIEMMMLRSLQDLAFLRSFSAPNSDSRAYLRQAVVSFYYSIYMAASAAVVCQSGSVKDDHSSVANAWAKAVSVFFPGFLAKNIHNISPASIEIFLKANPGRSGSDNSFPTDLATCMRWYHSALKNTAEWKSEPHKEKILKALKLDNFRTRRAQQERDIRLESHSVGFLDWCFRFRKNAHYNDIVHLTLGLNTGSRFQDLSQKATQDMANVAEFYFQCVYGFCCRRIGNHLLSDLGKIAKVTRFPIDEKIVEVVEYETAQGQSVA
jgi:hypothetical protein